MLRALDVLLFLLQGVVLRQQLAAIPHPKASCEYMTVEICTYKILAHSVEFRVQGLGFRVNTWNILGPKVAI